MFGEDRDVGGEVHVDLALFAGALGRDDDDTIGSAGTVDGRGGRVFQHVDAFDVVGVQVIDGAFHRQAVHHEERVGLGVHRADATDSKLAAIGRQTGDTAFEVLHQTRGVALFDGLGIDRGDGAGHFLLLDFLITGHHRALDEHAAVAHLHVEGAAAVKRFGHRVHTEESHLDGAVARILDGQGVITVDVGDGVGLFSQVLDGGAGDRHAVLVGDAAFEHHGPATGLTLLLGRRGGRREGDLFVKNLVVDVQRFEHLVENGGQAGVLDVDGDRFVGTDLLVVVDKRVVHLLLDLVQDGLQGRPVEVQRDVLCGGQLRGTEQQHQRQRHHLEEVFD